MKDQDLRELFLRFRNHGDMRALAKLFDAAAPQLVPVAVHLAARRDEADDLVQATFLSAIERAASYDESRPLLPWLLGILALHARKLREKHGRVLDIERVHQPAEDDPERLAAAAEVKFAVEAACRELPEGYAMIVRRHLVEGLEPIELANELGLSNGAARVRLHRGLKLLRRALPAAFASGAYAATTTSRGIAAIRAVVLERGSLITGSPVPAAGFAPIAIVLAFLVPFVVAVPAWFAWRSQPSTEPANMSIAAAPPRTESAVEPTSPIAEFAPSERVTAPRGASNSSSSGSSFGALTSNAIVRGRLLLPDGTPAVGASVHLFGSQANEERVIAFGLPTDWHDPELQQSDVDGRFEFSFDPPRAFQFEMRVEHDAAAPARWHWTELLPGTNLDLGDVALETVATLDVHIVDAQAQPLCTGWRVWVVAQAPTAANGRCQLTREVKCTGTSGEIVLEHLPARIVEIEPSCDAGVVLERRPVELVAGETKQLEIVYSGADLTRRITVDVSISRHFELLTRATTQVRVSKPGMSPRVAVPVEHRYSEYVVDDLEPGSYDVDVSDPGVAPWTATGVQPGEVVRAKLLGNAGVRLHLVNANGSAFTGHYAASLRFLDGNFASKTFMLLDTISEPPQSNLFTGLLPRDFVLTITPVGGPAHDISVLGLAPNETRDVSYALGSGLTLAGRVLASDGTTPLAGVDVQLTRGDRAGHTHNGIAWTKDGPVPHVDQHATSDAQGRFSFPELAAGQWTLRVLWGSYLNVDVTLDLTSNATSIDLVQPANGFLTGRLIVPPSAPLADARLLPHATNGVDFPMGKTGTDDSSEILGDGTFHIGPLPVGEVTLSLRVRTLVARGGFMWAGGLGLGTFSIAAGENSTGELDVRETFPGRVRVHVVIDGIAATDGFIECTPTVGDPAGGVGSSVGLDGYACVGALSPGSAQVTFTSSDDTWAWLAPQQVTVAPAQDTQLELAILTTARDLRCVDTATGTPLANVEVEWRRTGAGTYELVAHAKTDAQGLVHLKMPEQNVDVRCVGDTGAFTTIAWSAGFGPLTVALHHAP